MTLIQQSNTDPINADPVQRLLETIAGGAGMPGGLFVGDANLDAPVPMWRYETNGNAVRNEFAKWYSSLTTIERVVFRRKPPALKPGRRSRTGHSSAIEAEFAQQPYSE